MKTNSTKSVSPTVSLILLASNLQAQSIDVPPGLPDSIYTLVETAAERCQPEDIARFSPGGFQRDYDFNDDGIKDYVVDSSYFRCFPDTNLMYGGTAGTHYAFFVSQEDGSFTKEMHIAAHRMETVFSTTNPTFVFAHHGTACGYSGAAGCVSAFFWSNFENRFIGKGYD